MESVIRPQFNIDNNNQKKLDSSKTCNQCKNNVIECDGNRPCRGCITMGKPSECTDPKATTIPTKRGYKAHVPSACVNCKNAHLACDVSRPCRRCISLNKADTCHDMQHKKRGRPKLREKRSYSSNEHAYEVLYGTIQTPAITMKSVPAPPSSTPKRSNPRKIQQQPQQSTISFIHEPIESFRTQDTLYNINNNNDNNNNNNNNITTSTTTSTMPNNNNNNSNSTNNKSLEPPLPIVRLSANPQPFITDLPTTTTTNTTTTATISPPINQFNYSPHLTNEFIHTTEETVSINNRNANNTPITLQPAKPTTTASNNNNSNSNNNNNNNNNTNGSSSSSSTVINATTADTSKIPTSSPTTVNSASDDNSVTIIMSMEVCCAKVSDQIIKAWGYYPQELAHRSFYDFISPKDSDRLARLHRLLLDNATEIIKKNKMNVTSLPPTERSTSEKFNSVATSQLKIVANGARSFSDTIHIKQRSGDFELYEVIVHIGGGLGADLYDISSFSRQYIVAQFRKHQYEVLQKTPYSGIEEEYTNQASSSASFYAFSPMLSPVTPSSIDSPGKIIEQQQQQQQQHHQHQSQYQQQSQLQLQQPYIEQERIGSLSEIFNFDDNSKEYERPLTPLLNNSDKQMSFIKGSHDLKKESSVNNSGNGGLPKFNVAPLTDAATPKYHTLPIGGRLFKASETSNPLSNRFPPIRLTASSPSSVQVTHPTQQYFLQTSSSTLNAAASAAQSISRRAAPFGPPVDATPVNTASSRKIEMSIRSLLC